MKRSRGFTLIELMVSLTLGLVIIGGVVSVLLANKRSFSTNEGMSQVQESARTAFELIARDVRQSGGNGCDNNGRTANILNAAGGFWWQDWFGVRGIEAGDVDPAVAIGTAVGERVAGTDSFHVQALEGTGFAVDSHDAAGTQLVLQSAAPFVAGDIIMVCDFDHAAIFQATAYDPGTFTVTHDDGGVAPGNCSSGLGFPTLCDGAAGAVYPFPRNSPIGRLSAVAWYIGNNGRPDEGGRSLYRRRLDAGGAEVVEEVVAGVTDMQITYRMRNDEDIIAANDATMNWDQVNAVLIALTTDSSDTRVTTNPGVNEGRISRTFNFLITLRNRSE
jgi:type IV pilus assembly protein PilW